MGGGGFVGQASLGLGGDHGSDGCEGAKGPEKVD